MEYCEECHTSYHIWIHHHCFENDFRERKRTRFQEEGEQPFVEEVSTSSESEYFYTSSESEDENNNNILPSASSFIITEISPENLFYCDICNEAFPSLEWLARHYSFDHHVSR